MRSKLGVLIMEENGQFGMQIFENPDVAEGSFDQLKGRAGENQRRATFLRLEYNEDGSIKSMQAKSKDLPVPVVSAEDAPDCFVLGEGPRRFENE